MQQMVEIEGVELIKSLRLTSLQFTNEQHTWEYNESLQMEDIMRQKMMPTTYATKPSMEQRDYQIHYNRDTALSQLKSRFKRHTHQHYELYFLISGTVHYHVEERSFALRSGDVMLIRPGQQHYAELIRSDDPYERYVLWLHPSYLEQISTASTDLQLAFQNINFCDSHLSLSSDRIVLLSNLLHHIWEQSQSQEYGADMLARIYMHELLIMVARAKLNNQWSYRPKHLNNEKLLVETLDYIHEHIYEPITVQQMAQQLFVSRSFLSKMFTENMNISIHKYIVQKKLHLAKQDLLSGQSIHVICERFSFGDYSTFYRAFQREFGMSPRMYMQVLKEEQLSQV
ncbi:AraC family transcriptional regulator [Paenibacillus campi]|uniref:helix-turn-helix transcriptional regulator n=1 Tax=Paenibacillus campi TaxID=3106031 RepID=UPI002AFF10F5|nr:AraC family transcriptional regulator [Paenibacillus sp. SGZ-1014]